MLPIEEIVNENYQEEKRRKREENCGQNAPVDYPIYFYMFEDGKNTQDYIGKTYYTTNSQALKDHLRSTVNGAARRFRYGREVLQQGRRLAWNYWNTTDTMKVPQVRCIISEINVATQRTDVEIPNVQEIAGLKHFSIW
jgi:hypothetical protein